MAKRDWASGSSKLKENTVRIYRAQDKQICELCGRQIEVGEDTVSVPSALVRCEERSRDYYHRVCFNKRNKK